jgi:hypothetical protein
VTVHRCQPILDIGLVRIELTALLKTRHRSIELVHPKIRLSQPNIGVQARWIEGGCFFEKPDRLWVSVLGEGYIAEIISRGSTGLGLLQGLESSGGLFRAFLIKLYKREERVLSAG